MFSSRVSVAAAAAAALLAVVGAGTAATAAPAPLASRIHDGSFETPRAPVNFFTSYFPGQFMGSWYVSGGAVDLIGAGTWQAAEGDQSIDLNARGAVSQTFTTNVGTTYTVTYSLAGNPYDLPALKTGEALIDGQRFQEFSFDVTGKTYGNMGYVRRQFTFVATGTTTTLTFAGTMSATAANGAVIDDVCVEARGTWPSCAGG